jgi:hypothetical protein
MRLGLMIFLCLIFTLQSCTQTLSDKEVKEYAWKCGQNCGLGDVILFSENVTLRNDTILIKGSPYGKIVSRTSSIGHGAKISVINLVNPAVKDTCVFYGK